MNCSDSTPGPVIVKYEDDVPQISGKPCIDFQPDDRWQIKDDDEDCDADTPGKRTVVKDTKKSRDQSDERELDPAVNGDSDKIDSSTKEKHVGNLPSDSHIELKDRPILQNNAEQEIDHLNDEETTENLANTTVKVKLEKSMRNLPLDQIQVEQSDDSVNESASLLNNKQTEGKTVENCANTAVQVEPEESIHNLPLAQIKVEESDDSVNESASLLNNKQTEGKTVENFANAAVKVEPEKTMHDLPSAPVQIEQSHDSVNESASVLQDKQTEDTSIHSVGEGDKILQDGEKSSVCLTKNSVHNSEEDTDTAKQDKELQDEPVCSNDGKASADGVETLHCNSNDGSVNVSSVKLEKKPESELSNSEKAALEESPPKLEDNSSRSEELIQSDKVMPDISGSNSSGVIVADCKSECLLIDESPKDTQNSDDTENEVQVISSTSGSKCKVLSTEQNKSQEKVPHDVMLLNSLKGVLKAGQYKPVKFPHAGALSLAENEVIIESPSLLVPLLIKESDVFPKADCGQVKKTDDVSKRQVKPSVSKNFFESSVGKFLISLGMGRVEEWYHRDMKKAKLKQIKKYGPDAKVEEEFHKHQKEYSKAKEANGVFSFRLRRCQFCDFKSESISVMEAHYLIPHLSPRKEYKCNYCVFLTRDPKEIIFHFEAMHGKKAVLDFIMPFHECPFCCFQSHLKTKVNAHINRCRKHFMPTHNQAPPFDFEFPGVTTKPVTMADILAHRAIMNAAKSRPNQPIYAPPNAVPKGINMRNKLALINKISNQNSFNNVQGSTLVKQLIGQHPKPIQPVSTATSIHLPPGLVITRPRASLPHVQGSVRLTASRITPAVRRQVHTQKWVYNATESQLASSGISITPVTKVASQGVWTPNLNNSARPTLKNITVTPISSSSNQVVSQKPGPPQPVALFTNVAGNDSRNGNRGPVIMSVQSQATRLPIGSKIGSPRIHIPYQRLNTPPSQVVKGSSGNTFVMCEICDSYIKDLEELRTHMNWVHKVKIHPKMLVSRPPLNCQKCQWRFFTDQGLERHLLGAHGLVTTNMQEMANKNQDGGRCIICGAVFTYKLVSHMTQVHKVTLKPAHLSYKCTVCTSTFTLYRLFESHVYNVHSGSAKRPAEDPPASEPPSKKANVTVATPAEPKEEIKEVILEKCKKCDVEVEDLEKHLVKKHMKKCSVKLCHIEKCEKCLYSSDEILVIRMSDFGIEDDDDDSEDEDDEDDEITTVEIKAEETSDSAPLESSADKA